MQGILLNEAPEYVYAKLRFFGAGEHHCARICPWNVLLLVFEGVLRFEEDGVAYEVAAGEYFIQREGGRQSGIQKSDSPKYLFIHFHGKWADGDDALPKTGRFNYADIKELIDEADTLSDEDVFITEKLANFYMILNRLHKRNSEKTLPQRIADRIHRTYKDDITLEMLSEEFHFSKNYIIRIFGKEYSMTPIEYLNSERLKRAENLLEVTSYSAEKVAEESGYNSYSHFYRQFTRKNGLSPIEWRKMKRNTFG